MIELLLEAEGALSLGRLDRAEILYRQVAGADPRNSIAVVGLARVMLERGDEPGALKHARRALAIDTENVAAQRLVQRLEEVLEYRRTEGLPAAEAPAREAPAIATPAETSTIEVQVPRAPTAFEAPEPSPGEPDQASTAANSPPPVRAPSRSLIDRLLRRR